MSKVPYIDIQCNACGDFYDYLHPPTHNANLIRKAAKLDGWIFTTVAGGQDWCPGVCQQPILAERLRKKRILDSLYNKKPRKRWRAGGGKRPLVIKSLLQGNL